MKKMLPMMLIMLILVGFGFTFAYQGYAMHQQVAQDEEVFHKLQAEYFILSKAEREAAITGSELNEKLVQIMNTPSELMRMKLVGVGRILVGIFLLLFGILIALVSMPMRLAAFMRK